MNVDSDFDSVSSSDFYDSLSDDSDMVEETSELDDYSSSNSSNNIDYTDYLSNIENDLNQLISLQSESSSDEVTLEDYGKAITVLLLFLVLIVVLRGFVSRIRGL